MEVGVFLHEDGVHVVYVAVVDCVVVGRDYHTDGEFLVLLDIVSCLVVGPLGIGYLVGAFGSEEFQLHPDQGVGDLVNSNASVIRVIY